jgi:hypothetical protein
MYRPLLQSDELKEFLSERPWLLHDSLLFHLSFMEDLARIAAEAYRVTDEDVLDTCDEDALATEACVFRFEGCNFNVACFSLDYLEYLYQRGLQDVERPHLVLFVASLTGFDQTHGAEGVNKMIRSLDSLRCLRSSALMHDTSTSVIFTKRDLFAEKMRYSDIAAIADFEDFGGDSGDGDDALTYFREKFESCLATHRDDFVQLFDSSVSDASTIFRDFAKRLRVPATTAAELDTSSVRRKPEPFNGSGNESSLQNEFPQPAEEPGAVDASTVTVNCKGEASQSEAKESIVRSIGLTNSMSVNGLTRVDGGDYYTETIEV